MERFFRNYFEADTKKITKYYCYAGFIKIKKEYM